MGALDLGPDTCETNEVTVWVACDIPPADLGAYTIEIFYRYRVLSTAKQANPAEVTIRPGAPGGTGIGLARDSGCMFRVPMAPSAEVVIVITAAVVPAPIPIPIHVGWATMPVATTPMPPEVARDLYP
jgi:hypothetical protein